MKKLGLVIMMIALIVVFMPTAAFAEDVTDSDAAIDCAHENTTVVTTKATKSANGKKETVCDDCGEVIKTVSISKPAKVTLSSTSVTYDGKLHMPTVKVYDAKGNIISSTNYTLSATKGWKSVGAHKITVSFKGSKYSGSMYRTYTIKPKGTTMKSLSEVKMGEISARWNTKSSGISGYEVFCGEGTSTISKGTVKEMDDINYMGYSFANLNPGSKYYFKVRTYKIVNGEKIHSSWSSSKTLTLKKVTDYGYSVCSKCGGAGGYQVSVPGNSLYWQRCTNCNGEGYVKKS